MSKDVNKLLSSQLLIVEDDTITSELISNNLSVFRDIHIVADGKSAVEFCKSHKPDIIVLDVGLPDINGIELCQTLRDYTNAQSCPIVFITGCDQDETELSCWESGATDFVRKPLSLSTLQYRLLKHLNTSKQLEKYRELIHVDQLTGVFSRYYFSIHYESHVAYANRYNTDVALLLLDVDFFKKYNDHYGHVAGDSCLRQIASAIKSCVARPPDIVCRYGGEEFVVVLPGTDLDGGKTVAERIVETVKAEAIAHAKSEFNNITVSVGVSSFKATKNSNIDLIESADRALYNAKANGRCQVCAHWD
jgi:diguanylate cyclase (GGDEF)-like protein